MDAAPVDDDIARNEAPDIPFHDPRIEGFDREDRKATLKQHAYYWLRRQDRFWHAPPAELPPPREPTALPAGRETALALAKRGASLIIVGEPPLRKAGYVDEGGQLTLERPFEKEEIAVLSELFALVDEDEFGTISFQEVCVFE